MKKALKMFIMCICLCLSLLVFTACGTTPIELYVNSGRPTSTLGSTGDYYIDNDIFDIYLKDGNGWKKMGNVEAFAGENGQDGIDGTDGREVEFQTSSTHIQWRYKGEAGWKNLVALNSLKGADGADGTNGTNGQDGREVEFQKSSTHIQWRYVGENSWKNLVALEELKGADGTGAGTTGPKGEDGADGREVEFQTSSTHIQWRYKGESGWKNLVALDALKGADGTNGTKGQDGADGKDGTNGTDGREIELRKGTTHIEWRYVGDETWTNLIAIDEIKGADGENGTSGTAGTEWLVGTTDPENTTGKNGDFYVNTESSEIFTKLNNAWEYVGSFENKAGVSEVILGDIDLNGDGNIDEADVTLLKNFLNGEDITFPVAA